MNLNDFQNLLLNREELEKALGVTINKANVNNDFSEDYKMFAELRLHDVVCLYLDLHPLNWNAEQHPRYEVIYNAIQQSAENNSIPARIERDINGNITDVYLTHDTAKQWAKIHGLKWNVPPYRPLIAEPDTTTNNNNPDEIARLNAIIEQQAKEITELKDEIDNLKKPETAQATQPPTVEEKQNRISQPQRDIFTLLVMNNYQNCQSRNRLFEAINADMKVKGIRTSDIKYPTLDNLIDDNLKINNISPFPPKQK